MTGSPDPAGEWCLRSRSRRIAHLIALACLLAFLVLGDAPDRTRLWSALFDAGHAPLFGLVAIILASLLERRTPGASRWRVPLAAFAVTLVIAVASEALQVLQADREVSLVDLLRDLAGAAGFLSIRMAVMGRVGRDGTRLGAAGRAVAVAAAFLLFAAALGELGTTTAMYVARGRAFPVLFALDGSWWERRLITPGRTRIIPRQSPPPVLGMPPGVTLARLDLQPGLYPGLTFDEPYPDWRGYRRLVFPVVSDLDVPIGLTLRVHDARHDHRFADRFNQRLTINPGVNRIEIPLDAIRLAPVGRELDLARVRGLVLFAYRLRQPTHVYIGPLRLE